MPWETQKINLIKIKNPQSNNISGAHLQFIRKIIKQVWFNSSCVFRGVADKRNPFPLLLIVSYGKYLKKDIFEKKGWCSSTVIKEKN